MVVVTTTMTASSYGRVPHLYRPGRGAQTQNLPAYVKKMCNKLSFEVLKKDHGPYQKQKHKLKIAQDTCHFKLGAKQSTNPGRDFVHLPSDQEVVIKARVASAKAKKSRYKLRMKTHKNLFIAYERGNVSPAPSLEYIDTYSYSDKHVNFAMQVCEQGAACDPYNGNDWKDLKVQVKVTNQ